MIRPAPIVPGMNASCNRDRRPSIYNYKVYIMTLKQPVGYRHHDRSIVKRAGNTVHQALSFLLNMNT
jgi:hypothetical protein